MAKGDLFSSATFARVGVGLDTITSSYDLQDYDLKGFGEIYGGWGRRLQCYPCLYLGARVGMNFPAYHVTINNQASLLEIFMDIPFFSTLSTDLDIEMSNVEFTFDFKPGFVLSASDTMLFGLIGVAVNREKIQSNTTFSFTQVAFDFTQSNILELENKKTTAGLRLGVGLEKMITNCLSLQLNYLYTFYPKISVSGAADISNDFGNVTNGLVADYSVKPRRQVTSIGLAYYF